MDDDRDTIAPDRLERILAPLQRDDPDLAVRLEDAAGQVIAGGSSGTGSGAGPGARSSSDGAPSCVRDLVVDGAVTGRLIATGRHVEVAAVGAALDSLALALIELATEGHAHKVDVVRHESDGRPAQLAALELELAHGRQQQRRIVSLVAPDVPGFELASHYEAARVVGGDFFELFRQRRRGRPLSVVIADVTGKGIAAALLMAFVRPVLHGAIDRRKGPADALTRTNRILVEERRSALFITAICAELDVTTGAFTMANAGHEPPLLVRADGSAIEALEGAGPLLGMFGSLGLVERTVVLAPGDLILLYTDGITDAQGPSGDRFGDDRLLAALEATRGASAQGVVDRLRDDVNGFQGNVEPADDITIVALRRAVADA